MTAFSKKAILVFLMIFALSASLFQTGSAAITTNHSVKLSTGKSIIIKAPVKFKHTGMLNTVSELSLIKKYIVEGREPWKSAFLKMKSSEYAKINYRPTPFKVVSSDLNGANDHGANAEIKDAIAAYTQTLMWIFTNNRAYAKNAASILDAWSATLKSHQGKNWYLQASWAGSIFPVSAELLRATYKKWTKAEISRFSNMLNTAFLPVLNNRFAYGNRELSVCNALTAIGVFNNDRAAFYQGINHWISYIPCYFYISNDGVNPKKADYWLKEPSKEKYYKMDAGLFKSKKSSWIYADNNPYKLSDDKNMLTKGDLSKQWYYPKKYVNGLCGETGRDLNHSEMAFASAINVAEIAWHQGIDLYSLDTKRLTVFMETTASLRMGNTTTIASIYSNGITSRGLNPTYEIAYNHFHNIRKINLPNTEKLITTVIRSMQNHYTEPTGNIFADRIWGQAVLNIDWETLTHAQLN